MSIDLNPLLQQFIPEARDLLDQAGRSLLALEREPGGAEPMNALFRAVHTLKGTSGLFDILPLTRVVHAAEDLLDAVQAGRLKLAAETADVLLDALDQVGVWIDGLAEAGALPAAAEAASGQWVDRLRAPLAGADSTGAPSSGTQAAAGLPPWVAALSPADQRSCAATSGDDAGPLLAISYAPDAHCFFRGEDPLALMRQIEGLRLLRVEPAAPWPELDVLDPYVCNLRLYAIVAAPAAELEHLFRYVRDQIELHSLPDDWRCDDAQPVPARSDDTAALLEVLAGQRRLLEASAPDAMWEGRLGSASRSLRGALRHAGHDALVPGLEAAIEAATAAGGPAPLLACIAALHAAAAAPPAASGGVAAPMPDEPATPAAAETRVAAPTTLRVEQAKIDAMMNLIGELVVAKNALAYLARRAEDGSLGVRELAREIKDRQALVNRIAEEMQAAVMAVRMLPVEHVFQRFPRLVRDIARRLGKQVELEIHGGETEADKNVIEALADPLIHMVRNCLDHGIETPEVRRGAGKPPRGTIRLQALQDNDNVIIRVSDDGNGIDPDIVRRKAVEKGLLDSERAAALPDEEAMMLVFAPGFSTASAVSESPLP